MHQRLTMFLELTRAPQRLKKTRPMLSHVRACGGFFVVGVVCFFCGVRGVDLFVVCGVFFFVRVWCVFFWCVGGFFVWCGFVVWCGVLFCVW